MTDHLHVTLRAQSPGGGSRGRGVTHLQTAQTISLSLHATEETLKTAFSACLTFFIDRYQYNQHSLKTVSRLSQLFESTPSLEY